MNVQDLVNHSLTTYVRLKYLEYIKPYPDQIVHMDQLSIELEKRIYDPRLPRNLENYCLKKLKYHDHNEIKECISNVLCHKETIMIELMKEIQIHQESLIKKYYIKKI